MLGVATAGAAADEVEVEAVAVPLELLDAAAGPAGVAPFVTPCDAGRM